MSKSPAYQCYPKDLLSDLRCVALPNNQYGMYRKLLDHCWLENGLPDDPAVLAKAVGEPARVFAEKHWPVLRPFFDVRADGRLTQKRQEEEREKQRKWSEKSAEGGRKGAATRAQATGNHPSTTVAECLEPSGNIAFASPSPTPSPSPQEPGTNGTERLPPSAPAVRRKASSGVGEMPPIDPELVEMLTATEHLKPLADPKQGRFWRALERELEPYDWLILDDELRAADGWIASNPAKSPTVGGLADFFRRWCRKTIRDRRSAPHGQAQAFTR